MNKNWQKDLDDYFEEDLDNDLDTLDSDLRSMSVNICTGWDWENLDAQITILMNTFRRHLQEKIKDS